MYQRPAATVSELAAARRFKQPEQSGGEVAMGRAERNGAASPAGSGSEGALCSRKSPAQVSLGRSNRPPTRRQLPRRAIESIAIDPAAADG